MNKKSLIALLLGVRVDPAQINIIGSVCEICNDIGI
jgi:hypothetical protein